MAVTDTIVAAVVADIQTAWGPVGTTKAAKMFPDLDAARPDGVTIEVYATTAVPEPLSRAANLFWRVGVEAVVCAALAEGAYEATCQAINDVVLTGAAALLRARLSTLPAALIDTTEAVLASRDDVNRNMAVGLLRLSINYEP